MQTAIRTFFEHLNFVITADADDRVIEDAALVVAADRILDVGPTAEVQQRMPVAANDRVVNGTSLGVTPGFVDTHVHLSETLSRAGFPDSLDTRAWVFHWVMPYYGHLTPADERTAVRLAVSEMVRSGTTCFLDMGALTDPRVTVAALGETGIRGITGRHAADVKPDRIPSGWSQSMIDRLFFGSADAALKALEMCVLDLDGYADGRIGCWVNIQGKEPCSPELHIGARRLSERLGVGTTYHISSTAKEAQLSRRKYGLTPIARLEALEGLGEHLVLAHAVAVTEEEIEILQRRKTKVAFCPGASLKLAKGVTLIGRYPEMLGAGVTVSLGTDGVSASGNLNLMRQMHLVAGLFNDARMEPGLIGARRALRMATVDGAKALELDRDIGSVERGKKADFVIFGLDHPEWVPYQDPVQALVWSASPASIKETWVNGKAVFRDGRVLTIPDEASLRQEASERALAIMSRAGLNRTGVPTRTDVYDKVSGS
jgi:5-methylthioadenosine/S-adenosylhomocysteine deaminase